MFKLVFVPYETLGQTLASKSNITAHARKEGKDKNGKKSKASNHGWSADHHRTAQANDGHGRLETGLALTAAGWLSSPSPWQFWNLLIFIFLSIQSSLKFFTIVHRVSFIVRSKGRQDKVSFKLV